jgi:hypothetical protein
MGTAALAFALAGLTAFGGCAAVPTEGPVRFHPLPAVRPQTDVQVVPLPPASDADPATIVEGFLHAMGVYQPDYAIARQYLTREADADWNPFSGVEIYADGFPAEQVDDNVMLVAPRVGEVDVGGRYSVSSGQTRQDFGMVRDEGGQWRISHPPVGLLVSRYLFTNSWVDLNLHYLAEDGDVLVPDAVMLADGEDLLFRAITRQLNGPDAWLAPLVQPVNGMRLSELFQDGAVISVELRAPRELSASERGQVLAELTHTVAELGVETLQVATGANPWTIEGHLGISFSKADFAGLSAADQSPRLYLARSDTSAQSFPANAEIVPVVEGSNAIAVSQQERKLAVVAQVAEDAEVVEVPEGAKGAESAEDAKDVEGAEGQLDATRLLVSDLGSEEATELVVGEGLIRPAFLPGSSLLLADSSGLRSLRLAREGEVVPFQVDEDVPEGALTAFSVAPDGTRLAAAILTKDGPKLGLLRITSDGETWAVSAWRDVQSALSETQILDLGWSGENELSVLVADVKKFTSVLRVSADGARSSDIGPSSATGLVELACAPGAPTIVRSEGGIGYRFESDFNWPTLASGIAAIAYSH